MRKIYVFGIMCVILSIVGCSKKNDSEGKTTNITKQVENVEDKTNEIANTISPSNVENSSTPTSTVVPTNTPEPTTTPTPMPVSFDAFEIYNDLEAISDGKYSVFVAFFNQKDLTYYKPDAAINIKIVNKENITVFEGSFMVTEKDYALKTNFHWDRNRLMARIDIPEESIMIENTNAGNLYVNGKPDIGGSYDCSLEVNNLPVKPGDLFKIKECKVELLYLYNGEPYWKFKVKYEYLGDSKVDNIDWFIRVCEEDGTVLDEIYEIEENISGKSKFWSDFGVFEDIDSVSYIEFSRYSFLNNDPDQFGVMYTYFEDEFDTPYRFYIKDGNTVFAE